MLDITEYRYKGCHINYLESRGKYSLRYKRLFGYIRVRYRGNILYRTPNNKEGIVNMRNLNAHLEFTYNYRLQIYKHLNHSRLRYGNCSICTICATYGYICKSSYTSIKILYYLANNYTKLLKQISDHFHAKICF